MKANPPITSDDLECIRRALLVGKDAAKEVSDDTDIARINQALRLIASYEAPAYVPTYLYMAQEVAVAA